MTPAERIAELVWFQSFSLAGVMTPGMYDCGALLAAMDLPKSMIGKSVLDVGTNDGFFAMECARRGASRVVALDLPQGQWGECGPHRKGDKRPFLLNRELSGFTDKEVIDMEFLIEEYGRLHVLDEHRFDIVLCMGVLYHTKDPHAVLSSARRLLQPGGLLILETHTDLNDVPHPAMALYPEGFGGDPTNFCGPNVEGCKVLLKHARFTHIHHKGQWLDSVGFGQCGRSVFHAMKPMEGA